MSLPQITLWSFLTQSNAKQEIVCPNDLRVTIEEFAEELKFQLKDNQLPAAAELTQVNWDDTDTTQKLILVRYTDNQASTNVLQYSVGLEQLGKFAYLEKKIYLNPPKLPDLIEGKTRLEYRKKENETENPIIQGAGCIFNAILAIIAGIAALIAWDFRGGGVGVFFGVIAAIVVVVIIKGLLDDSNSTQERKDRNLQIDQQNQKIRQQNDEIDKWNAKKQKRDEEWQAIFNSWHSETLEVAYLSKTTDVFGRWTSAVSTTIDQVVQKLFIDRHAQAKQWQEERKSQEDIEKELKRRNAEMFG